MIGHGVASSSWLRDGEVNGGMSKGRNNSMAKVVGSIGNSVTAIPPEEEEKINRTKRAWQREEKSFPIGEIYNWRVNC